MGWFMGEVGGEILGRSTKPPPGVTNRHGHGRAGGWGQVQWQTSRSTPPSEHHFTPRARLEFNRPTRADPASSPPAHGGQRDLDQLWVSPLFEDEPTQNAHRLRARRTAQVPPRAGAPTEPGL